MEKGRPEPWPRSYWVDDHLIAGAYPGAPRDAQAEDKVRALVAAGVTLFLDLTKPADQLRPYESLLTTIDDTHKIRRVSLPVPDLSVAPHATVEEALRLLDAEAAVGGILEAPLGSHVFGAGEDRRFRDPGRCYPPTPGSRP